MNTKPILFQGDMVRAILDGRKTQTRRVVKLPLKCRAHGAAISSIHKGDEPEVLQYCPYGQPGDLLWVRETWSFLGQQGVFELDQARPETCKPIYRADGATAERWWPSIHMPRWASRLTLEVTDVRVERVQQISDEDALAEGIQWSDWLEGYHAGEGRHLHCFYPSRSFESLWDAINEPRGYGWDADPWVWVVEFRAIHANVDEVLANKQR